jgi:hypothetical protein
MLAAFAVLPIIAGIIAFAVVAADRRLNQPQLGPVIGEKAAPPRHQKVRGRPSASRLLSRFRRSGRAGAPTRGAGTSRRGIQGAEVAESFPQHSRRCREKRAAEEVEVEESRFSR